MSNYKDSANQKEDVQEQKYQTALKNTVAFKNIRHVLRNLTVDAAKLVEDNSLDWIFVDARHDYCGVMDDLIHWVRCCVFALFFAFCFAKLCVYFRLLTALIVSQTPTRGSDDR